MKYNLNGNNLQVTKEYELSKLQLEIINQIKETGKYITKNMSSTEEELALRELRWIGIIKIVPNSKKETHIFYPDVEI